MTKNFYAIKTWISWALALGPSLAFAATSNPVFTTNAKSADVFGLGCTLLDFMFGALIFVTIFYVVMAAYKYLTSGGDPDKVKEASTQLMYAAIALVVAMLARALPSIVGSIVGGDVTSTFFPDGCSP